MSQELNGRIASMILQNSSVSPGRAKMLADAILIFVESDTARATVPAAQQAIRMTPELRAELVAWGMADQGDAEADEALLAVLNAGAAAQQAGWVSVPVEPSDEQLRAALAVDHPATYGDFLRHPSNGPRAAADAERDIAAAVKRYKAYISAAASAPAEAANQRLHHEEPTHPNHPGHHDGHTCEAIGQMLADFGSQHTTPEKVVAGMHAKKGAEAASVRDRALAEAAALCDKWADEDVPGAVKGRSIRLAEAIRALQGKPEAAETGIGELDKQVVAWRKERARLDDLIAFALGKPEAASTCAWTLGDPDSGSWQSSCGEAWVFMDGGPVENSVRHCHGCGKLVAIKGGGNANQT